MTDYELAAIEERANRATPGPWTPWSDNGWPMQPIRNRPGREVIAASVSPDDQQFIAHARTDIPRLIAEIRFLREANEAKTVMLNAALEVAGKGK